MTRARVLSFPPLILLSLLAVLTIAAPAAASHITWTLEGVTLDGGGTVTGWFVYDTINEFDMPSFSVAVAAPVGKFSTTAPGASDSFAFPLPPPAGGRGIPFGRLLYFSAPLSTPPSPSIGDVFVQYNLQMLATSDLDNPGTVPLEIGPYSFASAIIQAWQADDGESPQWRTVSFAEVDIVAGALTSPVPVPASAFLLGSGLIGLAGMGWRRRRKI